MRALSFIALLALPLLTGCIADNSDPTPDDGVDDSAGALVKTSSSWANGELAKASGRLLDYSYAGYHHGEAAIPTPAVTANVKSFGAVGDGMHDDTQAFQDAFDKTASGAILVPAGHYVITKRITITKSNLVLRGEGTGKTILEFPKSLAEVDGVDPATFSGTSPYSNGPAFLTVLGYNKGTVLASVDVNAKRGSKKLTVSSTAGISTGQWLKLIETDVDNTLAKRLYGDHSAPGTDLTGKPLVHFYSRISAIEGKTITLERALPVDVETRWQPQISTIVQTVKEVGIEHLAIHFRGTVYPGHFKEHGYNAVQLSSVTDSWVRDVRVTNADIGVLLDRCSSTTLDGLTFDNDVNRAKDTGLAGHHAVWAKGGGDNLITNFEHKVKFVHDLSVEKTEFQTVFSNGKGVDLNMDHHQDAPYATLFTNLDLGQGTRPFYSGGGGTSAHSASFSTFWNIRSAAPFKLPDSSFGPLLNFVGVNTSTTKVPDPTWYLDTTSPVTPADLHEAERKDRVGR